MMNKLKKIMNVNKMQNIDPSLNKVSGEQNKTTSVSSDKSIIDGTKEGGFKDLLKSYIDKTSTIVPANNTSKSNITLEKKLQNDNEVYNSFNDLKINYINNKELNSALISEILKQEDVEVVENTRKLKLEEIKNKVNSGFYQTDDIVEQTAGRIIDSTII